MKDATWEKINQCITDGSKGEEPYGDRWRSSSSVSSSVDCGSAEQVKCLNNLGCHWQYAAWCIRENPMGHKSLFILFFSSFSLSLTHTQMQTLLKFLPEKTMLWILKTHPDDTVKSQRLSVMVTMRSTDRYWLRHLLCWLACVRVKFSSKALGRQQWCFRPVCRRHARQSSSRSCSCCFEVHFLLPGWQRCCLDFWTHTHYQRTSCRHTQRATLAYEAFDNCCN